MSSFLSPETANLKRISSSAAPRFHPILISSTRQNPHTPAIRCHLSTVEPRLVSRVASMRLCYSRLSHDDQQSLLSLRAQALTEIASPAHSDTAVIPQAQLPVTHSLTSVCALPRNSYTKNSAYLYSHSAAFYLRHVYIYFFHASANVFTSTSRSAFHRLITCITLFGFLQVDLAA